MSNEKHKCEKCGKSTVAELTWYDPSWPHFECDYTELWLCKACSKDAEICLTGGDYLIEGL